MKGLICGISMILTSSVFASNLAGKFGLGLDVGYPIPSFGNAFNDAANPELSFGVHARYHLCENFGLELGVSRADFKNVNLRYDNANLLGFYRTHGADDFTFVLGAGVGMTKIHNYEPKSAKLDVLARLGLEYNLAESLTIAANADYQYVTKFAGKMPTGRAHVVTPTLALTWYFGASEIISEVKNSPIVTNKVEEVKAEITNTIEEKKAEVMAKVETDTDKDGVLDSEDKCPNTKASEKVNEFGCSVKEKAEIKINVEFSSGKTEVAPEYESQLKEVADFLTKYNTVKVQIAGHTDNSGSAVINTKLSQKRAQSVLNALVKLGVEKKRMTAKGFGPLHPIADNKTEEGRQKNRRVVAVISTTK